MVRVLLVGKDSSFAKFLEEGLTGAGYRVLRTIDGGQAVACLEAHDPEVVLLAGAIECVGPFRARTDVPIIVLADGDMLSDRIARLDAGADDYLVRPFEVEELLARMRALLRGRALASARSAVRSQPGVLEYAGLELNQASREAFRAGRQLELRHRAFELLAYFMRHPERVLSRRELLEEVWGYEFLGGSNVIEVTVSSIRQAMEAAGEPRLIRTVRPVGYILSARRSP